jgi:membrane-bound lytic murein transglycosylase D
MKLFALFFSVSVSVAAQPIIPQVPHKLTVAGITLAIRDEARREIQKDVDALCQSPRHFTIKAERARTYFPTIEKIFAEERVPDDFKYLVLQESALIADAVSVSNAVGFWQFKDFTAREMGLRVDDAVDERMNIAAATRAAARYIKRNNYEFNNWIYALQAYQMGAGGVLRSVNDLESGTKHMTITADTYWYVKKFLAHKIAYEGALSERPQQTITLVEVNKEISLEDLAASFSINTQQLQDYNKWVRKSSVPGDRPYMVTIPGAATPPTVAIDTAPTKKPTPTPTSTPTRSVPSSLASKLVNGVPAIHANPGENMTALAQRAGISLPAFMLYNDLQGHEKIVPNTHYFTERKKAKAEQSQTIAIEGDNLWKISQRYAVSLSKLRKYNRATSDLLQPGQAVWLASKKPKPFNNTHTNAPDLAPGDAYFSWGAGSTATASITSKIEFTNNQETIETNTQFEAQDPALQTIETPIQETLYEVKPTDTLYSIAREHQITIKELMDLNGKKDFALQPGEKLRIIKK